MPKTIEHVHWPDAPDLWMPYAPAVKVRGGTTVYLAGGATLPDYRGRGAYRALVRARWDAAVERGTPVLTVGAGEMSRPILERLGFSIVGWEDCLLDPLD